MESRKAANEYGETSEATKAIRQCCATLEKHPPWTSGRVISGGLSSNALQSAIPNVSPVPTSSNPAMPLPSTESDSSPLTSYPRRLLK